MKYIVRKGIKQSEGERRVAMLLNDLDVRFYQEVELNGCINPKTSCPLRFDFYLPQCRTVIEYDGKEFHCTEEQIHRDSVKNIFCKNNGIRIIRMQGFGNIIGLKSYNFGSTKKIKTPSKKKKIVKIYTAKKETKFITKEEMAIKRAQMNKLPTPETISDVMKDLGIEHHNKLKPKSKKGYIKYNVKPTI